MAELLKTTFLGFFREDTGSTPVFQPRTQTCMAGPLITELEVRLALDCLNPHKGAGLDGLFPKFNTSKREHLPVGDTSNPVTYSLTSCTSSNAQKIQTVGTVRDQRFLNTR